MRARCRSSNAPSTAKARDTTDAPGVDTRPAKSAAPFHSVEVQRRPPRTGIGTVRIVTANSEPLSQRDISAEIEALHAGPAPARQPMLSFPPYRSSTLRHPTKDLRQADPEGAELLAPVFGHCDVDPLEADLTIQHGGVPIGERIVVQGRVVDGDGRPVRRQLVEVWQANAGGTGDSPGT